MESTSPTFSLIDFQTGKEKDYAYDLEDTILDLKRKVTKAEMYDDEEGTKVQLFWACVPLEDTELARNYVGKEEGIFAHFEDYPIDCKVDGGDTFVWFGKKRCVKLFAGDPAEKIKLSRSGNFAVMRSK